MAKSFKNLLSEVAQPKAGEEKAFKDQHQVQQIDAQPAGQDHIFKGTVQQKKRLADVMAGQDAAKYDAAYKNKNTEFSLPRDLDREVKEETQLYENPAEEKPMMMNQLRTMAHNLGGIARYINACDDCEEWFQNKLSGVAKEMQTLYGYATAETMAMGMKEETELEEASCGCGPECEHCGGDHDDKEIGEKCDCCGNTITEATAMDRARYDAADDKKKKPVTLPKAPWDKKNEEVEEDLDEAHHDWHVTFKTGHKPQRVKGRNTAEAIRKAEKRAQKSGEKDPRQLAMYKSIKKVSEEVEDLDEISMDLAKKAFSKRKGQAFDAAHRGDRKLASRLADKKNKTKAYINKREEVELDEDTHTVDIDHTGGRDDAARKHNITLKKNAGTRDSHDATGKKKDLQKYLAHHYGSHQDAKDMHPEVYRESVNPEQIDEISKELASRYLKRAPARAADAGDKIARAGSAYDKDMAKAQKKKGIRTFLNTNKGVERATNRLMKKEEVELEEKFTIRTSILPLDSGEKVKVSRQDAELLTKFFRELNPKNSREMRKVLVKDKQGYEEILGFAREAL